MKFITWCNNKKNPLNNRIVESAQTYGITLDFIGDDHPVGIWDYGRWCGRWVWLKEKLVSLHRDEVVMVLDSYDIIFLTNQTEIEQKFKMTNKRILTSVEKLGYHCFPGMSSNFSEVSSTQYKYPNPGSCMGYCGDLLDAADYILSGNTNFKSDNPQGHSDMQLWGRYAYENKDNVYFDDTCKIFMVETDHMNDESDETNMKNRQELVSQTNYTGRLKSFVSTEHPCVLHYTNRTKSSWGLDYLFKKFVKGIVT